MRALLAFKTDGTTGLDLHDIGLAQYQVCQGRTGFKQTWEMLLKQLQVPGVTDHALRVLQRCLIKIEVH